MSFELILNAISIPGTKMKGLFLGGDGGGREKH
jgi:hypothetical protein